MQEHAANKSTGTYLQRAVDTYTVQLPQNPVSDLPHSFTCGSRISICPLKLHIDYLKFSEESVREQLVSLFCCHLCHKDAQTRSVWCP